MYEIEGWIHEQHGKYNCHVAVWSNDVLTKTLLGTVYEKDVMPAGDVGDEHWEILSVIMSALSRHAEKQDQPLI